MLKSFTIACGQGATKAMIKCIEKGILKPEECIIVNSTTKDIPVDYREGGKSGVQNIIISNNKDAGCGKVRENAKILMKEYIDNNPDKIEGLLDKLENADFIHIMSTTEGASGSGASVVLAEYLDQALMYEVGEGNWAKVPIIITAISGWESDLRGVQNTINYYKDIAGKNYTIHTVSNKKYNENGLGSDGETIFNMEDNINESIAKSVAAIKADGIIDSDTNIDDTDHFKVITNKDLLVCFEINLKQVLNSSKNFNTWIATAIDQSLDLPFKPTAKKVAIYINIDDSRLNIIDTSFAIIKERLCLGNVAQELFVHRQNDRSKGEFIRIIASGLDFPLDEITKMYERLKDQHQQVESNDKSIISSLNALDMDDISIKDHHSVVTNNVSDSIVITANKNESTSTVSALNNSGGGNKRNRRRFGTTQNSKPSEIVSSTPTAEKVTVTDPAPRQNNNDSKVRFGTNKNITPTPFSEDNISG